MEAQLQPHFDYNELLGTVEALMREHGTVEVETIHEFSPGIYTRSIIVPPNVYLLSYIHKTEHQFIMSEGEIVIYTPDLGMLLMGGPYLGKTYPGNQRFALTLSKVTWTSIHATSVQPKNHSKKAKEIAIKRVEKELFQKNENVFLIKSSESWQA